ncbi:hypothetical protein MMC24_002724 [Lignoscripta atroalba]|nr:hypothetical protein [Lignoscripta atroalba]
MNGFLLFLLLLLLLVILPAGFWIAYTRYRAHKSGLPPPSLASYNPFHRSSASNYPAAPRPSGVTGWIQDKFQGLKNRRTAGGAYEGSYGGAASGGGRGGRGGFGPLDPDSAWDSRVGTEADAYGPVGDYEEQELGIHPPSTTAYGGSGYGAPSPALPEYGSEDMGRGRSANHEPTAYIGGGQRGLDQRYAEAMGKNDPFGDGAERSDLRGASPRPAEMDASGKGHGKKGSKGSGLDDSPTERKSMFREDM